MDLLRGRWWKEADRAFATQSEHEAIADALVRREPALARQRNESHVDNAWSIVEAGFKRREHSSASAASLENPALDVDV